MIYYPSLEATGEILFRLQASLTFIGETDILPKIHRTRAVYPFGPHYDRPDGNILSNMTAGHSLC